MPDRADHLESSWMTQLGNRQDAKRWGVGERFIHTRLVVQPAEPLPGFSLASWRLGGSSAFFSDHGSRDGESEGFEDNFGSGPGILAFAYRAQTVPG